MNYKVRVNGKEIEYGALVEKSRFSDEEWSAIYAEIVEENYPEIFEKRKSDTAFIDTLGALTSLQVGKALRGSFGNFYPVEVE